MQGENIQAGNNLRSLSQRTSYIVDWTERPKPSQIHPHHHPILQEQEHPDPPIRPMKPRTIQKETSEKYDLKKYEKKLENIEKAVFPLQRSSNIKPKGLNQISDKQIGTPNIFKQKHSQSVPWLRPIEPEYLRKKVELFKRKNTDSQRDLQVRMIHQRQKLLPLSLNAKRSQQSEKHPRVVVSEQDIDQIRQVIATNSKRSSITYLLQQDYLLPIIKAAH